MRDRTVIRYFWDVATGLGEDVGKTLHRRWWFLATKISLLTKGDYKPQRMCPENKTYKMKCTGRTQRHSKSPAPWAPACPTEAQSQEPTRPKPGPKTCTVTQPKAKYIQWPHRKQSHTLGTQTRHTDQTQNRGTRDTKQGQQ